MLLLLISAQVDKQNVLGPGKDISTSSIVNLFEVWGIGGTIKIEY